MSVDYKETMMYMLIWLSWGYNGVTVFDSLDGVEIYKRTLSVEILHSEMLTMVDDERGLHYETHDGYVYVDGDKHLFMRHVEAARQQASTMAEWLRIQQDQMDMRNFWK
jgi:L-ascorbate metabolism protein UlaG (beta-lactamase superfamily)